MKCIKKMLAIVSIIMALLIAVEIPVSALTSVVKQSETRDSLEEDQDYEFAGSSEEIVTSDLILGEIESSRTEFTKSFRLENGNNMIVEYDLPIHYQNDEKEWVDYDYSMVSSEKEIIINSVKSTIDEVETEKRIIDVYSAKDSYQKVSFAKTPDESGMAFLEDEENPVSWEYVGMNRTSAKVIETKKEYDGNDRYTVLDNLTGTVKYENAYPNVDLECVSSFLGIKENIIINERSTMNSYIVEYSIGNLKPERISKNKIALINKDKEIKYYISAPYMYDANYEKSEDLSLDIINEKNGILTIRLLADYEWLTSNDREYPVTIDPSFTTGTEWGNTQCAYVQSSEPDTPHGTGYFNTYVGYSQNFNNNENSIYRTYLKPSNMVSLKKGDTIVDVTINLYKKNIQEYGTIGQYSSTGYIGAYEVTSSWNKNTVTWNSQPTNGGLVVDYYKYTPSTQDDWFSWNITKMYKKWYENSDTNNGIMLKCLGTESNSQLSEFYSSNNTLIPIARPTFQITYRNNKGIEDYWSTTSFSVGKAGTVYVNDYSGALTFVTPMASTASPKMTAGINYVYNSYMAKQKYDESTPYTGRGWRMSIQQTLMLSDRELLGDDADTYRYVYTDADGTEHYIYEKTENNVKKYYDEDGLGLELTINNSNDSERFTLIDKDKNTLVFNSNGILRKIKDKNNNEVILEGSGTNILEVKDASNFLLTFEKNDNNYIKKIFDPDGKQVSVHHTTINGTGAFIDTITRNDGTQAFFTYDSNGLMTSITDNDGYKVEITYDNNSTKKVTQILEIGTNNTEGKKIKFDRSNYNTTIIQSSGIDGLWDNNDDQITTYQFDNYGRTVSVHEKTKVGKDLGASNYEYTAGEPNSTGSNLKYTNRLTKQHSLGNNTVNFMRNHSFEESASWANAAWGGTNTFTGSNTSSQRLYGQKSYRLESTSYSGTSAARAYQDITGLTPGNTYTLSGYVKVTSITASSNSAGALIAATSFNSDNTTVDYLSEKISQVTDININNGWRRLSITFTVPNNSNKIRADIALKAATGTVFFDAMQLEEAETASIYNLIENSSLEAGSGPAPTSWTGSGSINLSTSGDTVTAEQKQAGWRSFRIIGDPALNKGITQTVPVSGTENDTYIVSGWAEADAVPTNTQRKMKLTITVVYTDNTTKSKTSADFNPTISDWQYVSKAFTLDDGNANTNKTPKEIKIGMNYSMQANKAYFDNISLVKEPVASYTYDSKGNLISVSANAQQKSSLEYNADNQITKSVDPKGGEYTYSYDDNSRLSSATTQSGAQYTYSYDDYGNANIVEGSVTEGNTTTKIKSTQTISYPSANSSTYTVTNRDTRNKESLVFYNAKKGTLTRVVDPNYEDIYYTYNPDNDVMTSVSASGHTVSYSYDDSYKYLTGIQITSSVSPSPSQTTSYSFSYDGFGNRTSTSVGGNTLATYSYASGGGALMGMKYGPANGNGDYVEYVYDDYGNVKQKKVNDNIVYKGIADNTGTITKVIDPVNHLSYESTYDSTDRLISSTIHETNLNMYRVGFEYDYDLNNNVTKLAVDTPYGTGAVSYSYGNDNLLTQAVLPNSKQQTYTHDGFGRLTGTSLNTINGIQKQYTYLASSYGGGYTTNLVEEETIGTDTYKYTYDNLGNITKIQKKPHNAQSYSIIAQYTYDSLGQLTQADDLIEGMRYKYTYYVGGNINQEKIYDITNVNETLINTNSYTYGDANWGDLLKKYNDEDINYDAIGNPTAYRDGITFAWSNGRQLQTYSKGSTNVSYTYDTNGLRLTKDVGNSTHYSYLYHGGKLIEETIGNKVIDYFYDANGQAIAFRYKSGVNADFDYYYYAYNSRGDILGLYNYDGSVYCTYTYDAWGNILSVKNVYGNEITSSTNIANLQSLKYRGYVYDYESGLYYLQSRYYDPVTHRFINADGLVSTGTGVLGFNMFAYCDDNPIVLMDDGGDRPTAGTSLKDESYDDRHISCAHMAGRNIPDLNDNTTASYSDGAAFISVQFTGVDLLEFYSLGPLYTQSKLKSNFDNTITHLYAKGMPAISKEARCQLYGELLFHFIGYLAWDCSSKHILGFSLYKATLSGNYVNVSSFMYEKFNSAELQIIDGNPNDTRSDGFGDLVNSLSKGFGIYYDLL